MVDWCLLLNFLVVDDVLVSNMEHLFPTKVHKRKTGQLTAIFAFSADKVQIIITVFPT